MNVRAVILLTVTTGKVGAGGIVVKLDASEYVEPVVFVAITMREYVLLGNRPVKVAERLATPLSVEGMAACPLREYEYEVAPTPVQFAVNDTSVIELTVTTGVVGGGPDVSTVTVEFLEPVPFVATSITAYVVEAVKPVKVAVLSRVP